MALLLNRSDVQQLLTMAMAIDVVEAAFGELASKTAEMPPRTVMIDPGVGGWIAYMPAYLKSGGALGAKAVTVYKDNPGKFDLPTTIGTILVQNNETGEVVAAMDGGYLNSHANWRRIGRRDASHGTTRFQGRWRSRSRSPSEAAGGRDRRSQQRRHHSHLLPRR